ncbi:hypothetical protein ILP97_05150 [Amycolatopsis sp. H6(2020)]|nr:hypothetical protein [Amycolatopsis sp. H6(2020)]
MALDQAEVDQVRAGEVEVDPLPEHVGEVWVQVASEDALGGEPDFAFLRTGQR